MQYIYFFYNRAKAKEIPIDKQVGNAGGTVIVTKSKELITNQKTVISPLYKPFIVFGNAIKKPIKANTASTIKNSKESR